MTSSTNAPLDGEVGFDTKDGGRLTLKVGTKAMVQAERRLGQSIMEVGAELQGGKVRMETCLALFHSALIHQDPTITEDRAADLMDEIGPAQALILVGQAFSAAWPQPEDAGQEDGKGAPADPPKPPRGTKTKP